MDASEVTVEIEGFKTEKEFIQYLCRQIIGLAQDYERRDINTASRRLDLLKLSAETQLLLYGDGSTPPNMLGILHSSENINSQ